MKIRSNPKVFSKIEIRNDYCKPKRSWEVIGRINLVSYTCGEKQIEHLEFFLEEEHRRKGIMSVELPKYLKNLVRYKKYGSRKLIGVVKKDNIASIKLLEKNDFVRFTEFKDEFVYITDLDCKKSVAEKAINLINQHFIK